MAEVQKENYMGMISFSKSSYGSPRAFYGSAIKSDHPVTITIREGEYERHLSHDWYHAHKEIIEVELTPLQWAEFLTSGNSYEGVPCTIKRREGKMMDEVKQPKIIEQFEEETKEKFDAFETGAEKIKSTIKSYLDSGKGMTKKQLEELLRDIDLYKTNTVSNVNYVKDQFKDAMGKVVAHAKAEVNAFIETKANETGMAALQNNVTLAIDDKSNN